MQLPFISSFALKQFLFFDALLQVEEERKIKRMKPIQYFMFKN
jgi:hypothetical protein